MIITKKLFLPFLLLSFTSVPAIAAGICEIHIHLKHLADPKKSEKRIIQRKRDKQEDCLKIVSEFKPSKNKREILEVHLKWIQTGATPWE